MRPVPLYDIVILALALTIAVCTLPAGRIAHAQSRPPATQLGPLTLGGTVGVTTEAYNATGISARRPSSSGALFAAATGTAAKMTYGLDLFLTTEDDRLRQAMNRFALSASTARWNATVGDVSPVYSRFSVNGATIRGVALDYRPRRFVFSLLGGRSRRAIDTGVGALLRPPAFDRTLVTARAGYGEDTENHVHLVALVARDRPGSLAATAHAAPAENVSITPTFGLYLLDRRLAVRGELTASAFSQDARTPRTDENDVPSMLGLFTPRVGSRFDFAGYLETRYTHTAFADTSIFDQLTVLGSYERIQPGFVSLGRPYVRSDQAVFRFQPQARLLDRRMQVALDVTTRRNNLRNNRNATLKRQQVSLSTQSQVSETLFLNATYLWMANANTPLFDDPASQFLRQRLVSQTFMIAPVLSVPVADLTHRFSLTLAAQGLADRTERARDDDRRAISFRNVTSTLGHAVVLPGGLSVNSAVSVVTSRAPSTDVTGLSLTAGGSASFFQRRLSAGLTASVSRTRITFNRILADPSLGDAATRETSRQYGLTLTGTYRVTGRDVLRLTMRGFTTQQPLRGDFQEIQSSLRFEHRF